MKNLHLKNLKDSNNISEMYLNKAKDIFNLQTKVLAYASQITMKNTQLEIFKNEFISFFRNYDYICQNEQGSFHTFTQIITELQNTDIGTLLYMSSRSKKTYEETVRLTKKYNGLINEKDNLDNINEKLNKKER